MLKIAHLSFGYCYIVFEVAVLLSFFLSFYFFIFHFLEFSKLKTNFHILGFLLGFNQFDVTQKFLYCNGVPILILKMISVHRARLASFFEFKDVVALAHLGLDKCWRSLSVTICSYAVGQSSSPWSFGMLYFKPYFKRRNYIVCARDRLIGVSSNRWAWLFSFCYLWEQTWWRLRIFFFWNCWCILLGWAQSFLFLLRHVRHSSCLPQEWFEGFNTAVLGHFLLISCRSLNLLHLHQHLIFHPFISLLDFLLRPFIFFLQFLKFSKNKKINMKIIFPKDLLFLFFELLCYHRFPLFFPIKKSILINNLFSAEFFGNDVVFPGRRFG